MQEGKGYLHTDMRFFFIFDYVNRATGYIADAWLMKMNTICPELLLENHSKISKWKSTFRACLSSMNKRVRELEETLARLFKDHWESVFFLVKNRLLDHQCNDLEKSYKIQILDAAPQEYFNFFIETAYGKMSMSKPTRIQKTVFALM